MDTLTTQGNRSLTKLTLVSVLAFVVGLMAGLGLTSSSASIGNTVLAVAGDVVRTWTNAFRMLVGPLVATQLFSAITTAKLSKQDAGRIGVITPMVLVGLMVVGILLSITGATMLLGLPALQGISIPNAGAMPSGSILSGNGTHWVDQIIPSNLLASLATDNILPLMLFTLAFAIGAKRLDESRQDALSGIALSIRDVFFVMVNWLIRLSPIVLLGVGLQAGMSSGLRAGGGVLAFVALEFTLLIVGIAVLYPLTAVLGQVSMSLFGRAVLPAQITAAASRSSMATIPVLLQGANDVLGINTTVSAAILPLAGATLKLSRAVSDPLKLLFLSHFLNIPLGTQQIVVFAFTMILLSPGTAGVPSVTSGARSLPAYAAAGIHPEYVLLLGVTTAATDFLQTIINATGYLSATSIIARFGGRSAAHHPTNATANVRGLADDAVA